jgi:hypothetical protein
MGRPPAKAVPFAGGRNAKARGVLGITPNDPITIYQDGWSVHWCAEPLAAARESKITLISSQCANSPDTNPIENLFGIAEGRLANRQVTDKAKDAKEWQARFSEICDDLKKEGKIRKTVHTMPQRCRDLQEAKGGPTRW